MPEREHQNTLIGTTKKLEKKGFCDVQELRQLKVLRNAIAHDYTEVDQIGLFKAVRTQSPLLLAVFVKAQNYIREIINSV